MKRALGKQRESSSTLQSEAGSRGILRLAAVIGALALLTALPTSRTWAAGSCSHSISSCGCTITSSGFYQVTANLSAAQGLTASGACIDIASVGVQLWLAGFNIAGSGSGVGIELSSVGTFVDGTSFFGVGASTISDWNYGVELKNAIRVTMASFESNNNATAGVYLTNSINDTISAFDASGNELAGVLLDHSNYNNINAGTANFNNIGNLLVSSSNNQINGDHSSENTISGVEIGCPTTTIWSGCKNPLPSNGNQVYDSGRNFNGAFGTEVDNGNHENIVANTIQLGNGTTDLVDRNPSCDQDLWFANFATTLAPSFCIH